MFEVAVASGAGVALGVGVPAAAVTVAATAAATVASISGRLAGSDVVPGVTKAVQPKRRHARVYRIRIGGLMARPICRVLFSHHPVMDRT